MRRRVAFLHCLGISALLHAGLFAVFPYRVLKAPLTNRPLEVAYQATAGLIRPKAPDEAARETPPQDTRKEARPLWKKTDSSSELIRKDLFKKTESPDRTDRLLADQKDASVKKAVYMPSIPGETFKTPEYRSYYQVIREQIRRYAYFNYKKMAEGEVYLTFTLQSDGAVEQVMINKDKSSADEYLQAIALDSVQQAAPYPAFPEKLKKNPRLSFHVIIAFELK